MTSSYAEAPVSRERFLNISVMHDDFMELIGMVRGPFKRRNLFTALD